LTTFTRRLQKIGSSILVSLPKEWIDANNLEKSNQVEIETNQNNLSITAHQSIKPTKEIEIQYPLSNEESVVANVTGAYLLGYDLIRIKGKSSISIKDRESIRSSLRSLVAIEIIDEDAKTITAQFLLDESAVNPQKILKRMSSIVQGMFADVVQVIQRPDQLTSVADRDSEINRQYFLLVRLIRSSIVDKRLATIFNLGNIDILDYRLAANIIENAGDGVVSISNTLATGRMQDRLTKILKPHIKLIQELSKDIEEIQNKSVDAFLSNDRSLALTTIQLHKKFLKKTFDLKLERQTKTRVPPGLADAVSYLDLIKQIENYEKSWSDILDLIQPSYK
jgi:phosphate uptake regulator